MAGLPNGSGAGPTLAASMEAVTTQARMLQSDYASALVAVMLLMELAIVIDLRKRIVSDPEILRGKPCVKGTRISVAFVLYLLAGGTKEEEIVKYYPHLTPEDIRACFLYASENLTGRNPQWKFEGSFLDSDTWTLEEGDEAPTLESLFRHG